MQDNQELDTRHLWNEFSSRLRSFVHSKISDREQAEDVLQDIFIRIHQGLDKLRSKDRLESWIFGITRRAIADYYRKKDKDREESLPEEPALPDDSGTAAEQHMSKHKFDGEHEVHEEVLSWLIPMIDELPTKYAKPLRMADVDGLTQQEVADRLDLSLSGAKSRVQRAREKLGDVLAACCRVEFGEEGKAVSFQRLKDDNCESCD